MNSTVSPQKRFGIIFALLIFLILHGTALWDSWRTAQEVAARTADIRLVNQRYNDFLKIQTTLRALAYDIQNPENGDISAQMAALGQQKTRLAQSLAEQKKTLPALTGLNTLGSELQNRLDNFRLPEAETPEDSAPLDAVQSVLMSAALQAADWETQTAESVERFSADTAAAAQRHKMLQGILCAVAVIDFLVIVLFLLPRAQSRRATRKKSAGSDSGDILASIDEGLFLLDKNLRIGTQYSARLEEIIGKRDIGGKTFDEIFEGQIQPGDLANTRLLVEQLYHDWVLEELTADLNPLSRVEIKVDDFKGYFRNRYLSFRFSRVRDGQKTRRILVRVSDITAQVLQEKAAQPEKSDNSAAYIDSLNVILNNENAQINNFINTARRNIGEIAQILQSSQENRIDFTPLPEKVPQIYRKLHGIKGEAAAIRLNGFVAVCGKFEEALEQMQAKPALQKYDFIHLSAFNDQLSSLLQTLEDLRGQITALNHRYHEGSLKPYYSRYATDVSQRYGKQVSLLCQGVDDIPLTDAQSAKVREIALQLISNAIVHGIEKPAERTAAGKSVQGNLQLLMLRTNDDRVDLIVKDDGAGINSEAVRAKALNSMKYPPEEIENWDSDRLMQEICRSGFSTAENVDDIAGRGIGLDLVAEKAEELGGSLSISSEPGEFTQFKINFPLT